MAINKRLFNKTSQWSRSDNTPGIKLDSGPYIGIVMNNIDPTRSGRLQIWIPDLGGNKTDMQNWRTVSYASPFFGSTTASQKPSKNNTFSEVPHTYGFWMVPPDIESQVLVTFVAGDSNRGFWFACVPNNFGHHMVPGIAGSKYVDTTNTEAESKRGITSGSNVPVTEFNESSTGIFDGNPFTVKKPVHEYQYKNLMKEGLDRDSVRGAISSSSQRESPSQVYGISTPGRPVDDPAEDSTFKKKVAESKLLGEDMVAYSRKGGHTFVMDDGDINGTDNLIRLRTAGGHQILMNDTERTLYIANGEGSVWIELAGSGQMHIFSSAGFNLRTKGDMNFHSDGNIFMQAAKSFNVAAGDTAVMQGNNTFVLAASTMTQYAGNIKIGSDGGLAFDAKGGTNVTSSGALNFSGSVINLNNGGGGSGIANPGLLKTFGLNDTSFDSKTGLWNSKKKALASIVRVAPSHEPWPRQAGIKTGSLETSGGQDINSMPAPITEIGPIDCTPKSSSTTTSATSSSNKTDGNGNYISPSNNIMDPGPAAASKQNVSNGMPKEWLGKPDVPKPSGGIGPLSTYQTQCLMAQIAFNESRWDYTVINQFNFVGRYQFGAPALADCGYIKPDYIKQYGGNKCLNVSMAWTNKDGIGSIEEYKSTPSAQESAMFDLMNRNYKTMVRIGAIKSDDDLCTVAGLIQVAHLLGAGGAKSWRNSGGGADANGTTGATYFNRGRYAIDVLANQGTATA